MKPNPKMFKILVENLQVESLEVIHVGDTIFADIVGARKAEFHEGILFLGAFDDQYQNRNLENDFDEFKPCFVIDDYNDFPAVLRAIHKGEQSFMKIHNKMLRKRLNIDKS